MKNFFVLMLSLTLILPTSSSARSKYKNKSKVTQNIKNQLQKKKLSEFLLTSQQLSKLNKKDQYAYLHFLANLVYILELSGNYELAIKFGKTKKSSFLWNKNKFNQAIHSIKEYITKKGYYLDTTLLPLAKANQSHRRLRKDEVRKRKLKELEVDTDSFFRKVWDAWTSHNYFEDENIVFRFNKSANWLWNDHLGIGNKKTTKITDTTGPGSVTGGSDNAYKKVGASCIFAGHMSEYYESSNGTLYCRPRGVGASPCANKQVKCNDFGMDLGKGACIEPKNTLTVTKECVDYINTHFQVMMETFSDSNEPEFAASEKAKKDYDAYILKLKKHVDEFETAKTDGKLNFTEYCQREQKGDKLIANKVNNNIQVEECEAIWGLTSQIGGHYLKPPIAEVIIGDIQSIAKPITSPVTKPSLSVKHCQNKHDMFACTECGLKTLGYGDVSDKYLKLLDVMSERCYKHQLNRKPSNIEKQKQMANYFASLGYCSNYNPTKEYHWGENELKDISHFNDASYKMDMSMKNNFYQYFGFSWNDAEKSFCSADVGTLDAPKTQTHFNKIMIGIENGKGQQTAMRRPKGSMNMIRRHRSGWHQCDMELQTRQGQEYVSGARLNEIFKDLGSGSEFTDPTTGRTYTYKKHKNKGSYVTIEGSLLDGHNSNSPFKHSRTTASQAGRGAHKYGVGPYTDNKQKATEIYEMLNKACAGVNNGVHTNGVPERRHERSGDY